MKLLAVIMLTPIIISLSDPLFAQIFDGRPMPIVEPGTDTIDPPYNGEWGWHKAHKRTAKMFIRKDSPRKTDVCQSCHKEDKYRIFDPHTQLNEYGEIFREKCLYCHLEKPDEKHATFVTHKAEIKFKGEIEALCLGCHSRRYYIAHPVNANHLLKPKVDMLRRMKASEIKFSTVLPLDYKGKVMCATCHNPHAQGVIPDYNPAAIGAGKELRSRLPARKDICNACHDPDQME